MNNFYKNFLVIVSCFFMVLTSAAQASQQTFTVAVVPQYASSQIFRNWLPFLTKLEKKTGYHFTLLAYDEFGAFEKDFSNGIPDLIYLNPYHMVVARKSQNYQPLVRDITPISGILAVLKSGPIKVVTDLNGKEIAFPSPNAMGASLYMRALLAEIFHIEFKPKYVGSHQNVYREVLLGEAAAGSGIQRTFNKEPVGLKSKLSILYTTPDIASHPIAAHPRLNATVRKKITDAILGMQNEPGAESIMKDIQIAHPVLADYQRDYAELSKLRLDRYYDSQSR